jgi:endonuclease YncB( thermonuclease family)
MSAAPAAAVQVVEPRREVARWLLLWLALLAEPTAAGEIIGKVVKVHDGDTVAVFVGRQQVRIA